MSATNPEESSRLQTTGSSPVAIWSISDVILALAILALFRVLALVPREWLAGEAKWVITGIATLISQLFLLGYPILMARRRGLADAFRMPGLERFVLDAALAFPVVIGLFLMLLCTGLVLSRLAPHTSLTPAVLEQAATAQDYRFIIMIAVLAVTVAPVCEETFFRGFVYRSLRARLPVPVAALIQSAIFALLHTFGALHSIAVFFLGLILTSVYEWRKSLVTPIFVHAGNNLMAVLGLLLLMYVAANSPVLGVTGHDRPEGGFVVESVAPDTGAANAGIAASARG